MTTWTETTRREDDHPTKAHRIVTTLYDLVAAVEEAVSADEEAGGVPIVRHLLQAGHARFLRTLSENELLWDETVPSARGPVQGRTGLPAVDRAYVRQAALLREVTAVG